VSADPVVDGLREQITAADEAILEAVNTRIQLVARLKRHKEEHGIDFLDPGREQRLLAHLREVNPGPLSPGGVDRLFETILELVKRELRD
jgi:chorismate mutase